MSVAVDQKSQVEGVMQEPGSFTMFSKPGCPQCNTTERHFNRRGVQYTVIDMTEDADALRRVKELGYLQAPVVIAPSGEHWSGFNPMKIDAELTPA